MSESLLQKLLQKEPFIPANFGPSNADKFAPFPDGTIFINIKKEKILWLIVDNGKLRSFDGDLSTNKLDAIQKLNKLSSIGAYFGAFRSVISGLSDHPFRFKPITDSAIIRSLLV